MPTWYGRRHAAARVIQSRWRSVRRKRLFFRVLREAFPVWKFESPVRKRPCAHYKERVNSVTYYCPTCDRWYFRYE